MVGIVVAAVVVLVTCATLALNTTAVQQRLMTKATSLLEEQLYTHVQIQKTEVNVWDGTVAIKGLRVEDQQGVTMLEAQRVAAQMDLWALLQKRAKVTKVELEGIKGRFYTLENGEKNFQFALDALKKPTTKDTAAEKKEDHEKQKHPIALEVTKAEVTDVEVDYDDKRLRLGRVTFSTDRKGRRSGKVQQLAGEWQQTTKKGEVRTNKLEVTLLTAKEGKDDWGVDIDKAHWRVDNHLPRKNAGKPNRGAFDIGHTNLWAQLALSVQPVAKDSVKVRLTQGELVDSVAGLFVNDLRLTADVGKRTMQLHNVTIQQDNATTINIDEGTIDLPSKREGRGLYFQTKSLSAKTELKDIAQLFSPALKGFKIPLEVRTEMCGTDSVITFNNIHVNTVDKRLTLQADGKLDRLKKKELLDIRFHVKNMVAKGTVAQDIVNQFMVKKFMMRQLRHLGTLRFTGNVIVLYRKELFNGRLGTAAGGLDFDLVLDERTKYMSGHLQTHGAKLGKVLEMPSLADVSCRAKFLFDLSKQRTAQMRKRLGGNLPIGKVDATVMEAGYKKIILRNLLVGIESNGALATGRLEQRGKMVDLLCDFSFTSTDSLPKMKVKAKPSLKLHNLPWQRTPEEKAERKARKEQKKAERKARKEEKKKR